MIKTISVKKSFAKSAKRYALHAELQKETSRVLIEKFCPTAAHGKILDLGCGSGFTSNAARKKWPDVEITAVDIAMPMAEEARRNGVPRALAADAIHLPFRQRTFDGVVSSLAFQWIIGGDHGFFNNLSEVLKKGAFLCFAMMAEGTLAELRKAYSLACEHCTGRTAVFPPFPGESKTLGLMRGAGFADLRSEPRTVKRTYKNVDELFSALRGVGATTPARPSNPPRRDVLQKTKSLYPSSGGMISATYEICFFSGVKS